MSDTETERLREVETLARALVQAGRRVSGSTTTASMLDGLADRDAAYHDLTLALGEPCDCDPGTCPGAPDEDGIETVEVGEAL